VGAFAVPLFMLVAFALYTYVKMRITVLLMVDEDGELLLREDFVTHFWDLRSVWQRVAESAVRFESGKPDVGEHIDKLVARSFLVTDSYYLYEPGASEFRALALKEAEGAKEQAQQPKAESDGDGDGDDDEEDEVDVLGNEVPDAWIDEMPKTANKLVCKKMFDAESLSGITSVHIRRVEDRCHGYVLRTKSQQERARTHWVKVKGASRLQSILPTPNTGRVRLPPLEP